MTMLRRALCLLLIFALAAMTVTAAFSDEEDIRNRDAVTMLNALEVVTGFPDGDFRPEEYVTREQAAKMIASILQRKDDSFFWDGSLTFVDGSNWANEYIEYCVQRGIISGYDDGSFDPLGYITGDQMFKLLLVAIGMDPEPYVGEQWLDNVRADAQDMNLYDGFTALSIDPLTRDDACLLIFNALKCLAVSGYEDGEPQYFLDDLMNPITMLEYYFDARLYTEIVTGNEFADLTVPNGRLDEGKTKIVGHKEFDSSTGMEYLGRQVNIYLSSQGEIIGAPVFSEQDVVMTFESGEAFDNYYTLGQITLDDSTEYYLNYNESSFHVIGELNENSQITVIERDGDGIIDVMIVTQYQAVTIAQAGEEGWVLENQDSFGGLLDYDLLYEPQAQYEPGQQVLAALIGGQFHIK